MALRRAHPFRLDDEELRIRLGVLQAPDRPRGGAWPPSGDLTRLRVEVGPTLGALCSAWVIEAVVNALKYAIAAKLKLSENSISGASLRINGTLTRSRIRCRWKKTGSGGLVLDTSQGPVSHRGSPTMKTSIALGASALALLITSSAFAQAADPATAPAVMTIARAPSGNAVLPQARRSVCARSASSIRRRTTPATASISRSRRMSC
ncbi:MAG: hypothetical protein QOD42_1980 [Sphingomonadales bacterium]|nr:hypothetical protein [Sphingomonadales bacterium]